ncbi:MAG TPA: tRNA 2-thiouridine(34) synthase MnmA [Candidatus Nanoarchaeia archaeon]|nr:tRNA 2-thiouridine(34) synthase MnmA [Candidatus Nanoarchaeia archaeon]
MNLQKTVILGMSGGVDSSVAALLLQKQGYKVIGVFMKNFSDTKNKFTGECWWQDELRTARTIANMLNIELHVLDYESEYKNKVIKPMISDYAANKTPNPDIECNNETKFPALLKAKKQFSADFISTGHYANVKKIGKKFYLQQGKDKTKDQSYFLYKLTEKELSIAIFPLGKLTKEKVRKIAEEKRFPNWDKHGSAGVCFIGNVPLQSYLKRHIKKKQGKVIDEKGNLLGTHEGSSFYTIGQKAAENIGIKINKPKENSQLRYYVAKKLPKNVIQVAPENNDLLKIREIKIPKLYSPSKDKIKQGKYGARYRHLGPIIQGTLKKKNNLWTFTFSKPQEAIAQGQSIVLYRQKTLIAGGEIKL